MTRVMTIVCLMKWCRICGSGGRYEKFKIRIQVKPLVSNCYSGFKIVQLLSDICNITTL